MPGPGERIAACSRVSSDGAEVLFSKPSVPSDNDDLPPGCQRAAGEVAVCRCVGLMKSSRSLGYVVVLLSRPAVLLCRGKALGDVVPIWGCLLG